MNIGIELIGVRCKLKLEREAEGEERRERERESLLWRSSSQKYN